MSAPTFAQVDLQDLGRYLFTSPLDAGPVDVELGIREDDGTTSSSTIYDLHQFFVNLLLIGVKHLDLDLLSSFDLIHTKLKPYFSRLHVDLVVDRFLNSSDIQECTPYSNRYATIMPLVSEEEGLHFKMCINSNHQLVDALDQISTIVYHGAYVYAIRFTTS